MDTATISPNAALADRIDWYVSVARLAPSKHNAQPWQFAVGDAGSVELYADATRAMPASDPDDRELTIGCGAALRTYALAVRGLGFEPVVELLPDGPSGPLARITEGTRLPPTADELLLLAAVRARHTDRGPLDATAMPPATAVRLQRAAEDMGALLQLVTSPDARDALARLVDRARRVAALDEAFEAERRGWTHPHGPDGLPERASSLVRVPYGARFAHPAYARLVEEHPDQPLHTVLWTAGDAQRDWLRAGLALQNVLLTATVDGVAAGFDNAPLERPATRLAVRREVGYAGFPQVVLRLGAGSGGATVPTPRRDVRDLVI
jgi:nitroreductase